MDFMWVDAVGATCIITNAVFGFLFLNEYVVRGSTAAPIFSTFQIENIVLKRDRTKEHTYAREDVRQRVSSPLSGSLLALTPQCGTRKICGCTARSYKYL
jgi:hypothetical protein